MPRRRRRRANLPARLLLGSLLLLAAAYVLVPPLLEMRRIGDLGLPITLAELVEQQTARLLAAAWFFLLGASVGSFLNVVVWRVPRGKSLLGRSHCPWCAVQIKGRDNLPVFGWVLLRGRCRTCRLPIAARYPLVELTMGALFLLLLEVELVSGGANLPLRAVSDQRGILEAVFTPDPRLLGIYFFHCWLLFHLVAWTLIRWDGRRIPARYLGFVIVATLAAGVSFPWLHPVGALAGPLAWAADWGPWAGRLSTGLLGWVAGVLLGNELDMVWSRRRPQAAMFLGLAGAVLGWQTAFGIALAATALLVPLMVWRRGRPAWQRAPLGGVVATATLPQLLVWRQTAAEPLWPGPRSSLQVIVMAGLIVVVMQYVLRLAAGREQPPAGESPSAAGGASASAVDDGGAGGDPSGQAD